MALTNMTPKNTYEVSQKCQGTWAIAHPWVEMLWGGDGIEGRVKRIVCTQGRGHEVTMGAKIWHIRETWWQEANEIGFATYWCEKWWVLCEQKNVVTWGLQQLINLKPLPPHSVATSKSIWYSLFVFMLPLCIIASMFPLLLSSQFLSFLLLDLYECVVLQWIIWWVFDKFKRI